jgi:hypothetical protein
MSRAQDIIPVGRDQLFVDAPGDQEQSAALSLFQMVQHKDATPLRPGLSCIAPPAVIADVGGGDVGDFCGCAAL